MSDNLKIWDQFADIDPGYTKPITGKDYKGTSANPQYVIKCLTELFGPVGVGFGWRILVESIERFDETAIHWCRIEFWHTDRVNTFEAYGQTKMAYKTRGADGYLKVDEEAPKKSLTDAITKAASQVGIASNIFLGRWDDSKYVEEVKETYRRNNYQPHPAATRIKAAIAKRTTRDDLGQLWKDEKEALGNLPDADFEDVKAAFGKAMQAIPEATPPGNLGGSEIQF